MQYKFNIKDSKDPEVCDDFCENEGYQAKIIVNEDLVDNPESKHDFAERILKEIFVAPFISKRRNQGAQSEGDKAKGEL